MQFILWPSTILDDRATETSINELNVHEKENKELSESSQSPTACGIAGDLVDVI
jgi:hypothetical protein